MGPVQQEQGRLNVDRADPEQAQKKVDERAAAEKVLFEEAFDKPHDKAETALAGISAGDQPTSLLRTPTETPAESSGRSSNHSVYRDSRKHTICAKPAKLDKDPASS